MRISDWSSDVCSSDLLAQIGGLFAKPIAARVEPYKAFYPAETYHQDFMRRHPANAYIVRWDAPKLAAFRNLYPNLARRTAAPCRAGRSAACREGRLVLRISLVRLRALGEDRKSTRLNTR